MPRVLTHIDLQNDILVVGYVDTDDAVVDERALIIHWKKNPALARLMGGFYEIVGNYFLEGNKNLDELSKNQMDELIRRLLDDEQPET